MNFNTVVSLPAAVDLSGQEHTAVKLTANGVDIAGASDTVIGTVIRGAVAGRAVDVFLSKGNGLRFVRVGNATAIPVAGALEQAANGTFVLKTTGTTTGYAVEAAPAASNGGGMIRAIIL